MTTQMKRPSAFQCLPLLALLLSALSVTGAEKEKKEQKDADLFKPTAEFNAKDAKSRAAVKELETEFDSRSLSLPDAMNLEVAWVTPHLKTGVAGKVVKGWVKGELILLETDKHVLVAVDRTNGVEYWHCELPNEIRYEPSLSNNNVLVNCNNSLVAIEKRSGGIRWKLLPRFAMSCAPLMIDPVSYPKDYTKKWADMEKIYVGGWDGRLYHLTVRGRLTEYAKGDLLKPGLAAPEFDLFETWHKSTSSKSCITTPIQLCNNTLFYTKEDQSISAISLGGEEVQPYHLVGTPCTEITVSGVQDPNSNNSTLSSLYVGSTDHNVYCLDRFTLRKKWVFATEALPVGRILADEAATPFAYFSTEKGLFQALRITPFKVVSRTQPESSETCTHAWDTPGVGAIAASANTVYVGLSQQKGIPGYTGISAVEKSSGKVLWKIEDTKEVFVRYLGTEAGSDIPARIFAVTADNRVVALKEKQPDPATPIAAVEPAKAVAPKKEVKKDEAEKPAEK